MSRIYRCHIALGSNLGDRIANIVAACKLISHFTGKIIEKSSLYESEPWGDYAGETGRYINSVVSIETRLDAFEVLTELQNIERSLGRVRGKPNAPRTIDLDILLYGNVLISSPELTIPHPRMIDRQFVLEPLAEIDPMLIHPVLGESIEFLLARLPKDPTFKKLDVY